MCGRYYVDPDDDREIRIIIDQINDKFKDTPEVTLMKTGEIFPTNVVPAITQESPSLMKWGFTRYDGKGQIINARLETVQEKPMFKKPFFERRCLLPASHYFEWEKRGTLKQKYAIGMSTPLYLAGLYRYEQDSPLPVFVIITKPAAPEVKFIHDRMPVILTGDLQKAWLDHHIDTEDIMTSAAEELYYKEA